MSDRPNENGDEQAATEAAQNVVDEVTSWEYSAETATIGSALDEGLQEAGVDLEEGERRRVVDEIDEVKRDETRGAPDVEPGSASPLATDD
jgi:hypothetical protein